jgi:hypothetical protein
VVADLIALAVAVVAFGGVLVGLAARPWLQARVAGRRPPEHALGSGGVRRAAALLAGGVLGCIWWAQDAASEGGLLEVRPLAEQLLPVVIGVALGGCLIVVAWQPQWVARELLTMAGLLVVVAAAAGLLAGAGAAAGALVAVGVCLGGSALLRRSASESGTDHAGRHRRVHARW